MSIINESSQITFSSIGTTAFERPGYAVFNETNNLLVVRDIGTSNGRIHIYKYSSGTFSLVKYITAGEDNQRTAFLSRTRPIAISNEFIVVGQPLINSSKGAIYIIPLDGNGDPDIQGSGTNISDTGNTSLFEISSGGSPDINNSNDVNDYFGEMVAITPDSQWLFSSARGVNGSTNSGRLYVYRRTASFTWVAYQQIDGELSTNYQAFYHLSFQPDGPLTLISANPDVGTNSEIKVYYLDTSDTSTDLSGTYKQLGSDIRPDDGGFLDNGDFGQNSYLNQNQLVLVASDTSYNDRRGRVFVFRRSTNTSAFSTTPDQIIDSPIATDYDQRFGSSITGYGNEYFVIGQSGKLEDSDANSLPSDQHKFYVYQDNGSTLSLVQTVQIASATGLGEHIDMTENYITVTAPTSDEVYFYTHNANAPAPSPAPAPAPSPAPAPAPAFSPLRNNSFGNVYGTTNTNIAVQTPSRLVSIIKENTITNFHNANQSSSRNNIKAKDYREYIAFIKGRLRLT